MNQAMVCGTQQIIQYLAIPDFAGINSSGYWIEHTEKAKDVNVQWGIQSNFGSSNPCGSSVDIWKTGVFTEYMKYLAKVYKGAGVSQEAFYKYYAESKYCRCLREQIATKFFSDTQTRITKMNTTQWSYETEEETVYYYPYKYLEVFYIFKFNPKTIMQYTNVYQVKDGKVGGLTGTINPILPFDYGTDTITINYKYKFNGERQSEEGSEPFTEESSGTYTFTIN